MYRNVFNSIIAAGFFGLVLFILPGLVYAKGAPPLPGGAPIKTVGPSSNGNMTFFIEDMVEKVTFSGHCGNIQVDGTVDFLWAQGESPLLSATDLVQHGQACTGDECPFEALFAVPDGELADAARACYGIPTNEAVLLQFKGVKKFTAVLPDQVYTAEVSMGHAIPQ